MIDSLHLFKGKIVSKIYYKKLGLNPFKYALVTLFMSSNVDRPEILKVIIDSRISLSQLIPHVFLIHPGTGKRLIAFANHIITICNLLYIFFVCFVFRFRFSITASYGLQLKAN